MLHVFFYIIFLFIVLLYGKCPIIITQCIVLQQARENKSREKKMLTLHADNVLSMIGGEIKKTKRQCH